MLIPAERLLCRQKFRVCLLSLKVPCFQLMHIILEKRAKLRKSVHLRPALHSQKPAQTSISQNALKLMASMVSYLKSLKSPVKRTGLQLYQEDIVPSTKDWKELCRWDNHFSLIFVTPTEWTNKELINLVYNDVKKFNFYLLMFSIMRWTA